MTPKIRISLIVFLILFVVSIYILCNILENNFTKKTIIYKEIYNNFYTNVKETNIKQNYLVLVNKSNRLKKDYKPKDLEEINSINFINSNNKRNKLRKQAKEAFEKLSNDSIKNAAPVYGQSAYRSYETQENLFIEEMKNYGIKKAENQVARPGFSEHQTGLAIDVSSNKNGNMLNFENTNSFIWMKNNSYKYGFILRYPKNKEHIHGYIYEPWHYRYVGKKIANEIHEKYNNLTYDEYYEKFIENKKTD